MATGSAARSKTRRSRAMITGRADSLAKRTVARSALPSPGCTVMVPVTPSMPIVRA